MPRILTEEEKDLTQKALQQAAIALIKSKGLRCVTVDDLVKRVGLAKGSFYFYYKTKEALLYEALKISEKKMFDALMGFRFDPETYKESVKKALHEIYLADDSLALYVKTEDIAHFMRKVPAEIREQEQEKSQNLLAQAGDLFSIDEESQGTLAYLMNALQFLASSEQDYGKKNRQQSMEILVDAIADFLCNPITKKKQSGEANHVE